MDVKKDSTVKDTSNIEDIKPEENGATSAEAKSAGTETQSNASKANEPNDQNAAAAKDVPTEAEDPLKKAQGEAEEYKSLYLRKAADFENYRKRMIREKAEAGDYAAARLITDLLPIMDNFDRAISAEVGKDTESVQNFVAGIEMIKGQLEGMLSRNYGLAYYPSKGEPFDPNIHEAVAKQPSQDVKVETVGEEIQKGYKLREKVLRHAKVLVLMPQAAETPAPHADETQKPNA